MKKILILLIFLILAPQLQAKEVLCWGDSITDEPDEFCALLATNHGHTVHLWSQGGRPFFWSQIPQDIALAHPAIKPKTFIMELGTNDLNASFFMSKVRAVFHTQAATAIAHGYKLVIIVPPDFVGYEAQIAPIQQMLRDYCSTSKNITGAPVIVTCKELNEVWVDPEDHFHPPPELSAIIAAWLNPDL